MLVVAAVTAGAVAVRRYVVGVPTVVRQIRPHEVGVEGPLEVGGLGEVVGAVKGPWTLLPPPAEVVAVLWPLEAVLAPPVEAAAGVAARFGAAVAGATVAPAGEVPPTGDLLAGVAIGGAP